MEVGRPISTSSLICGGSIFSNRMIAGFYFSLLSRIRTKGEERDTGLFHLIDEPKFAAACSHLVYPLLNIASGLSSCAYSNNIASPSSPLLDTASIRSYIEVTQGVA